MATLGSRSRVIGPDEGRSRFETAFGRRRGIPMDTELRPAPAPNLGQRVGGLLRSLAGLTRGEAQTAGIVPGRPEPAPHARTVEGIGKAGAAVGMAARDMALEPVVYLQQRMDDQRRLREAKRQGARPTRRGPAAKPPCGSRTGARSPCRHRSGRWRTRT